MNKNNIELTQTMLKSIKNNFKMNELNHKSIVSMQKDILQCKKDIIKIIENFNLV